ncbi:PREDICTED: uncharacterized threonine-rich GPI-anchored glycoprotein PJ4664.02-like [Amphimedon queenslandica]|uniref:Ig-like domain-containing protein n=1 Tax=Amphimedon queenslandica TaxID=400682 RepID=A0A1X7UGA0_AMPQE|nr:PREDICTED: uncharacterized threonine-rich GPI-anchored glycoprotein PJ4664.02-like [Amphimedon queenslandica]|eukprot:XP_019854588.1 PREDICTED: uncharacterized threonine-rich GPI-anchored glycoprotein PJ4664.02-like [Amphimedon queenslandica]
MSSSLLFCASILLLIIILKESSAQCTTFQFTVQPPAELDCNPFDTVPGTPVWRLRTRCTAERLNGTQSFDVNWFHRKRTGEIENLSRPETWSATSNIEDVYFGNQLTNRPYTEDMLGEYWCQVVVQNQVLLGMSNVFTINDPYSYDVERCIGTKSVSETLCADNPPQVSVSSSALDLNPSSSTGITFLTISPTLSQDVPHSSSVTTSSSMTSMSLASVESSEITSVLISPISDNLVSTTSTKTLKSSSSTNSNGAMTSPLSTPSTTVAMVSPSSTVNNNISTGAIVMSTITSSTPTVSTATAKDNSMLLIVSAAAIVMLLLIIILLVVIIVLISTKPKQRREVPGKYHEDTQNEYFNRMSVRDSRRNLLTRETLSPKSPQRSTVNDNFSTIDESPNAHIYDDMLECSAEPSPKFITLSRSLNPPPHPYDDVSFSYSHNTSPIPPPPQFRTSFVYGKK